MDAGTLETTLETHSSVAKVPCCMTLSPSFKCRSKSAYKFKCGFVPPALEGPPRRFFRNVNCSTHYEWNQTLEYADGLAHPDSPYTGSITCDYTYTKTGCDGDGTFTATYSVNISELTGNPTDDTSGSDSGAGTGALAPCIEFPQPETAGGFPPPVFDGYAISERDVTNVGPATLAAGDGGCFTASLDTGETEATGTRNVGTADEYDYDETETVTADVQYCSEYTTEDLIGDVNGELGSEPWSEWDEGTCCCWRTLPENEESYSRGDLQIRLDVEVPCTGTVRVTYYTVDSEEGDADDDATETAHEVDVSASGTVIDVAAPDSGYRCVTRVEARIV